MLLLQFPFEPLNLLAGHYLECLVGREKSKSDALKQRSNAWWFFLGGLIKGLVHQKMYINFQIKDKYKKVKKNKHFVAHYVELLDILSH